MSNHRADSEIIQEYIEYIASDGFPCIAAKAAVAKQQVQCIVADHLACPHNDEEILQFIYDFVDSYRDSDALYHSAAVIFKGPEEINEELFENLLWMRLQSLADLDLKRYDYDKRVDSNPDSGKFSFSLKEEAFFIIGLHPANSRLTRRFNYPVLTFNPHAQFEELRDLNKFENMQRVVRKRDLAFSGSVNPMLENYGTSSEAHQYSGKQYDDEWQCPLNINDARSKPDTAA
ncbi:MAG TPA: guanitoxin biosynthesis heme-dependent pre-guanitoxin N-hydroxylase GntA [Pedobacter sp.]|jgi:hypothetical protein